MISASTLRHVAVLLLVAVSLNAFGVDADEEDDDDEDEDTVTLASNASPSEGSNDDEDADDDDEEDDDEAVATVRTPGSGSPSVGSLETSLERETHFGGWLELRPSFSVGDSAFHAENETALSFQFASNRTVGYTQEWAAGLFRSADAEGAPVVPSGLGDGYLWATFADIWKARRGNVRLSYEPRVYLPTASTERDAGLVAATRQMIKLDVRVASQLELFLYEVPVLALHTRRGYESAEGPVANRTFENRVEFGLRGTFWDERVTLELRTVLQSRRFVNFDSEADNNDQWSHLLYVYPELTVRVFDKTTVGAAYYSDSLVTENLAATRVDGFRRGVVQMVLMQEI